MKLKNMALSSVFRRPFPFNKGSTLDPPGALGGPQTPILDHNILCLNLNNLLATPPIRPKMYFTAGLGKTIRKLIYETGKVQNDK